MTLSNVEAVIKLDVRIAGIGSSDDVPVSPVVKIKAKIKAKSKPPGRKRTVRKRAS